LWEWEDTHLSQCIIENSLVILKLIPEYGQIIDEPLDDVNAQVGKIPTTALLFIVSAINARIDAGKNDLDNLVFMLRRVPDKLNLVQNAIYRNYVSKGSNIAIFSKINLCRLAMFALDRQNNENRDTTPLEDWCIFKIYVALLDVYVKEQDEILKSAEDNELGIFNNLTWPMIADQNQFIKSDTKIFDTIKSIILIDELIERDYQKYIENYSKRVGMPIIDFIHNIFNISRHKFDFDIGHGVKTPSFFIKLENSTAKYLNSLVLDLDTIQDVPNYDSNFLAIKKYPLLKYDENNLAIIDRQFLEKKLYTGFLFDFYNESGISEVYKRFDTFKSVIGKHVSEERLFQTLIGTVFPKSHHQKYFSEKEGHPDCYLRINNRIFLFEFKDYMMSSRLVESRDPDQFKEEIDKKFVGYDSPKGVAQLANQINHLSSNDYDFDPITEYGLKRSKVEIYPLIIYTDNNYALPGVNEYLKDVFDNLISEDLPFKYVCKPTMISANFLFRNAPFIAKNRFDKIIKQYYIKLKEHQRRLEKQPHPNNWIRRKLSFDDANIKLDSTKYNSLNYVKIFFERMSVSHLM